MITIKTNGIEITVETEEEFRIVTGYSTNLADKAAEVRAANLPETPAEKPIVEEPKEQEHNNNSGSNVTHINTVNGTSRYYTHVPPGTRRFRSVARIYDYVESHKRGRTTMQVVERFGISKYSANSTLNTLKNEGLIYQPNGRGTAWLATVDVSAENSVNEDNHANES